MTNNGACGGTVEALHYPEGHWFDSQWCHCSFSLISSFWLHCGPGVNSASSRNEYQPYFLGGKGGQYIGLTTSPPSCTNCLEIFEPQPPGNFRACPGLQWDCFTFAFMTNIDEKHDKSALDSFFNDRDLNFAVLNSSRAMLLCQCTI